MTAGGCGTGFVAPSYQVVDVTVWYAPAQVPGPNIAGGRPQIFDETCYDAVSMSLGRSQPNAFYSELGRSFMLNVSKRF